jgi:sulfoxide reductase heme-binding subunit YedZ
MARAGIRSPRPPQMFAARAVLFVVCLLPLARLALGEASHTLGANTVEVITRSTGTWTLGFLLITLGVTPLRKLTGWNWLPGLRRMFGLFAFFYAALHFTTYFWLDHSFDLSAIFKDVVKRPFISVGFASFLLLIPLAATSTDAMLKRLGARNWRRLHRAIYLVAAGGVVHFWWLVKYDITEPVVYADVLVVLLGARLLIVVRARRRRAGEPAARPSTFRP